MSENLTGVIQCPKCNKSISVIVGESYLEAITGDLEGWIEVELQRITFVPGRGKVNVLYFDTEKCLLDFCQEYNLSGSIERLKNKPA
jgi:hypothetical protein